VVSQIITAGLIQSSGWKIRVSLVRFFDPRQRFRRIASAIRFILSSLTPVFAAKPGQFATAALTCSVAALSLFT